jgi:hypothetical protein
MAQGKTDTLEQFAKRIETRVKKSRGSDDGMEQLICRILTGADKALATKLAEKWVEWRFGKPKQSVELTGEDGGPVTHTISFER